MKESVKLHISVLFGWGIILFAILATMSDPTAKTDLFVITGILLALRYSVLKPVGMLGTIGTGLFYISLWDLIFGNRQNYLPNTAIIILLPIIFLLLLFTFLKGTILALYFLGKETYTLVQYYKNNKKQVSY